MKVVWTPEAEAERLAIGEYIALENPVAAVRIDKLLEASVLKLADFPQIGRPGAILGTRELLPHTSYRIVYQIGDDAVWIIAIVHTSRQWPPVEDDA